MAMHATMVTRACTPIRLAIPTLSRQWAHKARQHVRTRHGAHGPPPSRRPSPRRSKPLAATRVHDTYACVRTCSGLRVLCHHVCVARAAESEQLPPRSRPQRAVRASHQTPRTQPIAAGTCDRALTCSTPPPKHTQSSISQLASSHHNAFMSTHPSRDPTAHAPPTARPTPNL